MDAICNEMGEGAHLKKIIAILLILSIVMIGVFVIVSTVNLNAHVTTAAYTTSFVIQ